MRIAEYRAREPRPYIWKIEPNYKDEMFPEPAE